MPSWLTSAAVVAVPTLVQLGLFLRWLHRRMRDDEIQRAFVRDMAVNHLPHIYRTLVKMAAHQGIALEEAPLVQFIDLGGSAPLTTRRPPSQS